MLIIGCHLSTEKGYTAMGEQILAMGGNTFQYFTTKQRKLQGIREKSLYSPPPFLRETAAAPACVPSWLQSTG